MSIGIAAVGTVLFDRPGNGHGAVAFVGAADHALLVAVVFLGAAWAAVCWLPKHARATHQTPRGGGAAGTHSPLRAPPAQARAAAPATS